LFILIKDKFHLLYTVAIYEHSYRYTYIPYKNKCWCGTKFGELVNHHTIANFKSCQYFFYCDHSCFWMISKLLSCQIHYFNKSPNIISTNICSYTICCYLAVASCICFSNCFISLFRLFNKGTSISAVCNLSSQLLYSWPAMYCTV